MPTYQYACTQCDHRFEAVQAFTDPTLTDCPKCHGHLRKVYGSVGVVFKGSGFYRTDSRSGSSKASLGPDHSAEKSSEKSKDTSTGTSAASPKSATKKATVSAGSSTPAKAAS